MIYEPTNWQNGITPVNADNLNKIEQGISEVSQAVEQLEKNNVSAIVCNAKGAGLTISDCSALPFQAVKLQGNTQQDSTTGKNLYKGNSITASNAGAISDIEISLANGKTYTVSLNKSVATQADMYLKDADHNDITKLSFKNNGKNTLTFTPSEDVHNIGWYIAGAMSITDIQIEEGSTATAYEPYTGGIASPNPLYPQPINSAVVSEIKVSGKNLLKNREIYNPITISGIKFTKNEDGSITFDGVQDNHSYYDFGYSIGDSLLSVLDVNEKYILSGNTTQNSNEWGYCLFLHIRTEEGSKYVFNNTPNEVEFDLSTFGNIIDILPYIRVGKDAGKNPSNITFYPMIRKADISDGTYEPYQENTITLSSPIELNKIGGIADEVAEGKVTHRIVARKLNSLTFTYDSAYQAFDCVITDYRLQSGITCMSNRYSAIANVNGIADMANKANYSICFRGAYANRMYIKDTDYTDGTALKNSFTDDDVVYYLISEPVVTDLPTEDVLALDSLHGYKPVTYITTDSEVQAIIDVDYVADTKTYIDNKFNQLATALVAGSEV